MIFFSLLPASFRSATASVPDTLVNLSGVTVYARRPLFYEEDKKVIVCDSALVLPAGLESLGELLQRMAPLSLMQYGGAGSLATLPLRGSSSSQTQVNWNGFPINALTSGIADLSQLSSGMFEEILLIPGASGSLYGSGTSGGAVNLDNRPVWKKRISAAAAFDAGSFGTRGGNFILTGGTEKFQSKSGFFLQNADNDFTYRDDYKPGRPEETALHNLFRYAGFIQTFSAMLPRGYSLQAGFWVQKKKKQIPAVMGSYKPGLQVQRDSSMRMYLILGKRWVRSSLSFRNAWFRDNMWFTDKSSAEAPDYTIDSRFRTSHFMSDLYYRHKAGRHWTLDGGVAVSLATAAVTAYNGTVRDYSIDLYAGSKYQKGRWTGSLTLRQDFNPYTSPLPQADAGMRYALLPGRTFLRFNLSTKYRLPTLNDKYWTPGGNPDLRPEHGWGATAGIDLNTKDTKTGPWSFRWQTDLFFNLLNDQIRWIPGEGYWHPENVDRVRTWGAENILQSAWKRKNLTLTCRLNYNFTKSTVLKNDGSATKPYQSSYIPVHTASGTLRADYRFLYAGIYEDFTGARYTAPGEDPLYRMDPFALTSVVAGGKKNMASWDVDLRFIVKNLFNARFQVVRSYPMPGRAYLLKARITFRTNSSNQY